MIIKGSFVLLNTNFAAISPLIIPQFSPQNKKSGSENCLIVLQPDLKSLLVSAGL